MKSVITRNIKVVKYQFSPKRKFAQLGKEPATKYTEVSSYTRYKNAFMAVGLLGSVVGVL